MASGCGLPHIDIYRLPNLQSWHDPLDVWVTKLQALALGMSQTLAGPDKRLLDFMLVISRSDLHATQRHRSKTTSCGHGLALYRPDDRTRSISMEQCWGFSNPISHAELPNVGGLSSHKA